jgi:hypothetical protein
MTKRGRIGGIFVFERQTRHTGELVLRIFRLFQGWFINEELPSVFVGGSRPDSSLAWQKLRMTAETSGASELKFCP